MSQVAIEKLDEKKAATATILDEMKAMAEQIRQRAFGIFERRGGVDGSDVDDWLRAEQDLIRVPESELVETDGKYEIRVSAPGFEAGDLEVSAMPDSIIVKGTSTHTHEGSEGDVRFCEFGQKTLFRRFELPEAINLDKVKADLEKGVLRLTAVKQERQPARKLQVAA